MTSPARGGCCCAAPRSKPPEPVAPLSDHAKGLAITALGILLISPDTLLIRLAAMDVWTLAVWRGVFQAIGITLILTVLYRRRTPEIFRAIGWTGVVLAALFAVNTITFLGAIQNTKVANALVMLATAPLFAAILSRLLLKEHVPRRIWLAIAVAVAGICLIVWEGLGQGTLLGDGLAIFASLVLGAKFTIIRHRRAINMVPAMAISGLFFAAGALAFSSPLAVQSTQMLWVAIMGLAVIAPAITLTTLGPRYIPAAEVGLLTLGETVLGPLWVWLVIHETPTPLALLGGGIVVAALLTNALLAIREQRRLVRNERKAR